MKHNEMVNVLECTILLDHRLTIGNRNRASDDQDLGSQSLSQSLQSTGIHKPNVQIFLDIARTTIRHFTLRKSPQSLATSCDKTKGVVA
jgi:hypothetical protein